MDLTTMSGLEVIQAVIRGELPPPSITNAIPMIMAEAEAGRVIFLATANENHLNPMGGVHGGFAATVLDSVTGCAVHTMMEPMVSYSTIDLNIKMMRPLPQHEEMIAEGRIVNLSKSLGVAEGTLKNKAGKLLATATATCLIKRL
ncbi:hypothetical protein SIN8267_01677 [Sinobacterium norvegicum]|uniref:Thioesterase domain-containing protein n=1 Tax=Sinobacterium norvegicum TaxID=1641715 RepID=A0ABM9AEF1_9GAMM|nr:PaaI family thioesterase [Sinobacterium norvegicum]CAH0991568.1 hypothetical protein SIN8267_01677 [Sinobacterium norvegicum]